MWPGLPVGFFTKRKPGLFCVVSDFYIEGLNESQPLGDSKVKHRFLKKLEANTPSKEGRKQTYDKKIKAKKQTFTVTKESRATWSF